MPGLAQSGPVGQGSMTSRRLGRCTNFGAGHVKTNTASTETQDQTWVEDLRGRGMDFGFWRGRGGRDRGRGMGRQDRLRGRS